MYSKEKRAEKAERKVRRQKAEQILKNERDNRRKANRFIKRARRSSTVDRREKAPRSLDTDFMKDTPTTAPTKVIPVPIAMPDYAIDITAVDLVLFVQKAYELSNVQGMGFLHASPAPMALSEAQQIADAGRHNDLGFGIKSDREEVILDLDYVHGRAVKMCVYKLPDGRRYICKPWYDHSDEQLRQLLTAVGVILPDEIGRHNPGCNCGLCQIKRHNSENN